FRLSRPLIEKSSCCPLQAVSRQSYRPFLQSCNRMGLAESMFHVERADVAQDAKNKKPLTRSGFLISR
ncbi:hypothetical protein, partial [Aeromonas taiwanensis]|uniref:hypothetical protein n=1 Tax=Aeromonas taiwanensis TaxID=633417 RepID=UPI001F3DEA5D